MEKKNEKLNSWRGVRKERESVVESVSFSGNTVLLLKDSRETDRQID